MKLSSVKIIPVFVFLVAFTCMASSCYSTSANTDYRDATTMTQQFSEPEDVLRLRLQKIVDAQIGKNHVHEIVLSVSTGRDESALYLFANDEPDASDDRIIVNANTPYFTASTSKLFATTLVLQLVDEGKLSLEDSIVDFFPQHSLDGLHEKRGVDRTADISIRHLLAHTSGLPDYFSDKRLDGTILSTSLLSNQDSAWSVTDVIDTVKNNMTPLFIPGAAGKAHYSDTNFQLLGAIIEKETQVSLVENIDTRISQPLNLQHTYLYTRDSEIDRLPVLPLRRNENTLSIPKAMESVRLDGGMVSTSADSLKFIQAFMQGTLFDSAHLAEMQQWNSIGYPLKAGVGILKFNLPKVFSLFQTPTVLIGHSGISGAFAFYNPPSNVYIAGTINQLEDQSLPYKFMQKIVNAAKTK